MFFNGFNSVNKLILISTKNITNKYNKILENYVKYVKDKDIIIMQYNQQDYNNLLLVVENHTVIQ